MWRRIMGAKLTKARSDMETSTGVKGPIIDIFLQFLPMLLQLCGLTPKQARQEAIDHPVLATQRATVGMVRQGFSLRESRQAAKGYIALANSTPAEDADDLAVEIEAE
jgi:hypothetical protein